MKSSSQPKSPSSSLRSPLDDEDFSDVTKKEILYWSRKLEISPSQLFIMPTKDLEERLKSALQNSEKSEEEREKFYKHLEHMSLLKSKLIESQRSDRLKGGAGRNIWDILAEAASQIEEMYGDSSFYDQSGHDTVEYSTYDDDTMASGAYDTYNASRSCAFPTDMTYTLSDEEPSYETTFEDSFQINPNLASTPRGVVCGPRNLPKNDTYSIPATTLPNATFLARTASPANATYTTRECPLGSTYTAREIPANSTYNVRQRPMEASYKIQPHYLDESLEQSTQWSPQSMAFMDQSQRRESSRRCPRSGAAEPNSFTAGAAVLPTSTPNQTMNIQQPSFRNYTDYLMKYSPGGTEESANSISVEKYDETSGVIRASSRSYTLPPSANLPNKTFDIPSTGGTPRSTKPSPSPARCPVPSAAPQCPSNSTAAAKTPLRTPPNPRTYRPRKLTDDF